MFPRLDTLILVTWLLTQRKNFGKSFFCDNMPYKNLVFCSYTEQKFALLLLHKRSRIVFFFAKKYSVIVLPYKISMIRLPDKLITLFYFIFCPACIDFHSQNYLCKEWQSFTKWGWISNFLKTKYCDLKEILRFNSCQNWTKTFHNVAKFLETLE